MTRPQRCASTAMVALLASVVGALTACANRTPPTFHTLMAPASSTTAASAAPAASTRAWGIRIEPVRVPAQVDQPQWVVRQPDGDLQALEEQRWVAALGDEWRDALGDQLAKRLGVLDLTHTASRTPAYRVQLDVQRFDTAPGDRVVQETVWTLRSPDADRAPLTCHSRFSEPTSASYAAAAEAHRRALGRLADAIAGTLQALQSATASSPAHCPG